MCSFSRFSLVTLMYSICSIPLSFDRNSRRVDATGFEPAFSAPLRSALNARPLDGQGPLRPKRSLRETVSSTCHSDTKKGYLTVSFFRVDATGFEPAASASRTQRSTKLSHASSFILCLPVSEASFIILTLLILKCKLFLQALLAIFLQALLVMCFLCYDSSVLQKSF